MTLKANLNIPTSFLEEVHLGPFWEEPAVKAYYLVAIMLLEPEVEDHFFNLQSYLEESASLFPERELQTLYTHLNNFCIIQRINAGLCLVNLSLRE